MNRSLVLIVAMFACWIAPLAFAGGVVINEIHFQPADKTVPEEFLELYHTGAADVDLSGWFFSDGISYTFPQGTTMSLGDYLLVAEDPETMMASFGVEALGPYNGRLSNDGDRVRLRNAAGGIEDEVDYRVRFPWPIAPRGRGNSMELIHPRLDNDLAGSWRASGSATGPAVERVYFLNAEDANWHYRKSTSEASDPASAWRQRDFVEDTTWLVGQTSIGYGDGDDKTLLDDMRNNYTGVYLRHVFTVEKPEDIPKALGLGVYVDDGAIVWINGVEVGRFHVRPPGEVAFDGTSRRNHEARWEEAFLANPRSYLLVGQNVLAIQALNSTISSDDFSIDATLFIPGSDEPGVFLGFPTPGEQNSVFSTNAPPQIRQVKHLPQQPAADQPITITAKMTDPQGVAEVLLHYQIVAPGAYIPALLPIPHNQLLRDPTQSRPLNPDFEDPANWATVPMVDDGSGGDELARDRVYTAVLPGQGNRSLVRYRISAKDSKNASVRVPYADDKSLNFACFVYDGVPPFATTRASVHPEGRGHIYPVEVLNSLPVYFLITRERDLSECIAYDSRFRIPKSNEEARDKFNWEGAFVYEGVVYDHIKYRLRQANDRYGERGKRSMRIRFRRGNYFQARNNYGKEYPVRWRTLNTGKMFDNKDVGNFGLTETINHDLWNLVGVPSPWMYTFHLRVIDAPDEAPEGTSGQYLGDFWGMFVAIEDYDARFMDTHSLADGNLYKLKDGIFDGNELRRNQGRFAIKTDEDFQNIRRRLRPQQMEEWLNAHVNYDRWYPYHAVVEAIRHYDFRPSDTHSKNRAWYFEPDYTGSEFGRLWTLPWDSDASWGPNWNNGIDYSKDAIFGRRGKPAFKQKYRNFIREFRDLIWTEEVIHQMIDDLAAFISEFSMADRDRWRGAPARAGTQDFGPLERKVQDMKRFAFVSWSGSTGPSVSRGGRARHLDNLAGAERDRTNIPDTPMVTSTSPPGFPLDSLTFTTMPFNDPQGIDTFAAMKWRVGEVSSPNAPEFDPQTPRIYEWPAVWESEELTTFLSDVTIPPTAVKVGHTYRVRVRMKDDSGRWSHWSEPVEFTVGEPFGVFPQESYLRITEIMYHPVGGSRFEFIEFQNIGPAMLDLSDVSIRDGIRFSFREGEVTSLAPGEYVILVKNRAVFSTRYRAEGILIAGEYAGKLSNVRERVELTFGESITILDFSYDELWYPITDGRGYSLVIRDAGAPPESWSLKESWRPSREVHGSPGTAGGATPAGLQLPGNVDQDGSVNITDAVSILRHLFFTSRPALPCGNGTIEEDSNRAVLDINGDRRLDLTDAIHLLNFLFRDGLPPALGTDCVPIEGCPNSCVR